MALWVMPLCGCGGGTPVVPVVAFDAYGGIDPRQIQFKDVVTTNAATDASIADLLK